MHYNLLLQETSTKQFTPSISDISDKDTVDNKVGTPDKWNLNKASRTLLAVGSDESGDEDKRKAKRFLIKNFIKKSSKPKKIMNDNTVQHPNTKKVSTSHFKFVLFHFIFTCCSLL